MESIQPAKLFDSIELFKDCLELHGKLIENGGLCLLFAREAQNQPAVLINLSKSKMASLNTENIDEQIFSKFMTILISVAISEYENKFSSALEEAKKKYENQKLTEEIFNLARIESKKLQENISFNYESSDNFFDRILISKRKITANKKTIEYAGIRILAVGPVGRTDLQFSILPSQLKYLINQLQEIENQIEGEHDDSN